MSKKAEEVNKAEASNVPDTKEFINEYLNFKQSYHIAKSTLKFIKYRLSVFNSWLKHNELDVGTVSHQEIEEFFIYLRKAKKDEKHRFSKKGIYQIFSALKGFFDFLVIKEVVKENAIRHIEMKPPKRNIPRDILTEPEIKKIIKVLSTDHHIDKRNKVIFELMYNTGLRSSEVVNLTIYDIDFDESILYVHKGKGNKNRIVPLNDYIRELIKDYLENIRPEYAVTPGIYDCLFVSNYKKRLARDELSRFVRRARLEAGITKKISPHSIRHTFASHLLKNGAGIRYISEILGHEFLSTTEIYTRVFPVDLKEKVEKYHPINHELGGICGSISGF